MTKVDFHAIRPIRGTSHSGFEELCCQLACHEPPTAGSRFIRNGTPDGGVEAFRIFANGTERGWQAKYFFEVGDSQWQQMDESVATAIEKVVASRRADFRTKYTKSFSQSAKGTLSSDSLKLIDSLRASGRRILDLLESFDDILQIRGRPGDLATTIDEAIEACWRLNSSLTREGAIDEPVAENGAGRRDRNRYYGELRSLEELRDCLHNLSTWVTDHSVDLASRPAILLTGPAGNGKTHLFCDIARRRVEEGLPSLVLLGEQMGEGNVWDHLRGRLGLVCSRDVLLGALDSAAEAADCRAVIFIDAINEATEVKWQAELPSMLTVVARYWRVAIAVSCRTTYVDLLVRSDLYPGRIDRIEHDGFASRLFEALTAFCRHYGIESLNTPPLNPEFENPLFLKLFCKGLHARGLTRPPRGHHGLQHIFSFYIDAVDKKLSSPSELDYPESDRLVHRSMDAFADVLFDDRKTAVSRDRAKRMLEEIRPTPPGAGYSQSLLKRLIAEGLLADDVHYPRSGHDPIPIIRFGYERFLDFQIARRLVERSVVGFDGEASIETGSPLGLFFGKKSTLQRNGGILAALIVLVPEIVGTELSTLWPEIADSESYKQAFIEALPWREAGHLTPAAFDFVDEIIEQGEHASERHSSSDPLLEKIIQVAAQPGHPMNADWLHGRFSRMTMPERDLIWSTFLHRSWQKQEWSGSSPIPRLLEWAWPPNAEDVDPWAGFDDDVIRLAGIILAWCFASSDRYLRDRATKGFVSIFRSRLSLVAGIMDDFRDVDDPYVHERIMCAAYGCVMRSDDPRGSFSLAGYVYNRVFAGGSPPSHLLARDYARGIVEYALWIGMEANFDVAKIRPPYQSEPIDEDVPSWEETKAETLGKGYEGITLSLMPNFGDFSRYVIGSDSVSGINGWSAEPDPYKQVRAIEREKVELPDRLERLWACITIVENMESRISWYTDPDEERVDREPKANDSFKTTNGDDWVGKWREERDQLMASATQEDLKMIEHNADVECRRRIALDEAEEQFTKKGGSDFPCRWIAERVIELGWTPERFGEFDHEINRNDYRSAKKAERIGKKYQWIAYQELLARTTDHKPYHHDHYDRSYQYDGTWQLSVRDIDPSFLIKTKKLESLPTNTWWSPLDDPIADASALDDEAWLIDPESVPDFNSILEVRKTANSKPMFNLSMFLKWKESDEKVSLKYGAPSRRLTFSLYSFIVTKSDIPELVKFAGSEWGSIDLSERDFHYRFLGEFPWAPSFGDFDDLPLTGKGDPRSDVETQRRSLGDSAAMVAHTVMRYAQGSNDFDCSQEEAISGNTPSVWLARRMGLRWARNRFRFMNATGEVVCFDPSHEEPGPDGFVIDSDELAGYLKKSKMTLAWFIVGEKLLMEKDGGPRDDREKPCITVFRRMYPTFRTSRRRYL